jgi:hypothetical protein
MARRTTDGSTLGTRFSWAARCGRWANLLAHQSNNAADASMAADAVGYARAQSASRCGYVGGCLLANLEAQGDPLHIAVVGPKDNAGARSLFLAALGAPVRYRQIEWLASADHTFLRCGRAGHIAPGGLSLFPPGLLAARV